jgi:hypothetical protein
MLMHAQHQQPMPMQFQLGLHLGGDFNQQQHIARVSYDTHEEDEHGGHHGRGLGGSALLGRKHAPDRRPLRFWQPFNGACTAGTACCCMDDASAAICIGRAALATLSLVHFAGPPAVCVWEQHLCCLACGGQQSSAQQSAVLEVSTLC